VETSAAKTSGTNVPHQDLPIALIVHTIIKMGDKLILFYQGVTK